MKKLSSIFVLILCCVSPAIYGQVFLYGPGGPHTALKAAAEAFTEKTGLSVTVTAGPQATWEKEAQTKASIIFGASDQSMVGILRTHANRFDMKEVTPLYLRDAILLVRKGNPKKFKNLADFVKRDGKAVVNDGAGVSNTSGTGVWEDILGRMGDVEKLARFRKNIALFTPNSGASRKAMEQNMEIDGWITWVDWAISNPDLGDVVAIEPAYVISRSMNIVVAKDANEATKQFAEFLQSKEAEPFFTKFGWYKHKKVKKFWFF